MSTLTASALSKTIKTLIEQGIILNNTIDVDPPFGLINITRIKKLIIIGTFRGEPTTLNLQTNFVQFSVSIPITKLPRLDLEAPPSNIALARQLKSLIGQQILIADYQGKITNLPLLDVNKFFVLLDSSVLTTISRIILPLENFVAAVAFNSQFQQLKCIPFKHPGGNPQLAEQLLRYRGQLVGIRFNTNYNPGQFPFIGNSLILRVIDANQYFVLGSLDNSTQQVIIKLNLMKGFSVAAR